MGGCLPTVWYDVPRHNHAAILFKDSRSPSCLACHMRTRHRFKSPAHCDSAVYREQQAMNPPAHQRQRRLPWRRCAAVACLVWASWGVVLSVGWLRYALIYEPKQSASFAAVIPQGLYVGHCQYYFPDGGRGLMWVKFDHVAPGLIPDRGYAIGVLRGQTGTGFGPHPKEEFFVLGPLCPIHYLIIPYWLVFGTPLAMLLLLRYRTHQRDSRRAGFEVGLLR